MSVSQEYTVTLKKRQYEYLTTMANKHDLADADKALRCLINFAVEETQQEDSIFNQIRCQDCG